MASARLRKLRKRPGGERLPLVLLTSIGRREAAAVRLGFAAF